MTLRELQRLVNEHSGLLQSKNSTTKSVDDKKAELNEAEEELKGMAVMEVSAALRSTLSEAQTHRNTAAAQTKLDTAVTVAQRALVAAQAGLGQWGRAIEALQQMSVPSPERLTSLVTKRQRLESELNTAADRAEEAGRELDGAQLEVKQFSEARHIVTGADVRAAREWGRAKAVHAHHGVVNHFTAQEFRQVTAHGHPKWNRLCTPMRCGVGFLPAAVG